MKLNLVCTSEGFRVATDADYEQKRKLKKGAVYECTIKQNRNYKFHKLYFALIGMSWEYLTEDQRVFFHDNVDLFRKTVEVAAGHCDLCYSIARREWIEIPKSISFHKLDESSFGDLYEKVKNVIYNLFIPNINKEEFEQNLKDF